MNLCVNFAIMEQALYALEMRKPSFKEERKLWKDGIEYVLGIDEVGRGAFAGPIVAAGVVFPKQPAANVDL